MRVRPGLLVLLLVFAYIAVGRTERTVREVEWTAGKARELSELVPPLNISLAQQELGERPFRIATIDYPIELIRMVESAAGDKVDIFRDFETLIRAWRDVAGDRPLTLGFVSPPQLDWLTGRWFHGSQPGPEIIDPSNFEEKVVFLRAVRDLILRGNGAGWGSLAIGGFRGEPIEFVER